MNSAADKTLLRSLKTKFITLGNFCPASQRPYTHLRVAVLDFYFDYPLPELAPQIPQKKRFTQSSEHFSNPGAAEGTPHADEADSRLAQLHAKRSAARKRNGIRCHWTSITHCIPPPFPHMQRAPPQTSDTHSLTSTALSSPLRAAGQHGTACDAVAHECASSHT